jgi:hypothetical protein
MINCTTSMVEGRPVAEDDELSVHFIPTRKLPHAKSSSPSSGKGYGNSSQRRDGDNLAQYGESSPKKQQLPPLQSTDDSNIRNNGLNSTGGRGKGGLNNTGGLGVGESRMNRSTTHTNTANPSPGDRHTTTGRGKATRSAGGRQDKFSSLAKQIAGDPTTWEDVWASDEYCDIFEKLLDSRALCAYRSKYRVDHLRSYREEFREDKVLQEVMALALKEHEQLETFANLRAQKLLELSADTASLLRSQLDDETRRSQRVRSLATRTLQSHIKIDEHQEKVALAIERKKEATLRKQEAAERRLLENKDVLAAQVVGVEKALKEHEERRLQIQGERERAVTSAYEAKLERGSQSLEMQTRLLQDVQRNVIRNSSDNNTNADRLRVARELDDKKREESAAAAHEKEERHARRIARVKEEEAQRIADAKLRQSLLEFKCEQRKRLFNHEREQSAALQRIEMEKLNAYKELQDSLAFQRPNALKQVFQDTFDSGGGLGSSSRLTQQSSAQSTPGPGEYDVTVKRKVIGGYMSARTKQGASSSGAPDTPGPGGYEPDASVTNLVRLKEKNGVLPFRGRGRSDVDWLMMEASRRPGPGSYNFDVPKKEGGKFGCAKLKSDLDARLESKRNIPGPGAYDVNPGLKKQTTLAAIAKQYHVPELLEAGRGEGQYADLLRAYK